MWNWLARLFGIPSQRTELERDAPPPEPPAVLFDTLEAVQKSAAETTEALELARKAARGQSKLTLQVEQIEQSLQARLDAVQSSLLTLASRTPPAAPASPASPVVRWDDLLDALDLLDHACRSLDAARDDGVREGLERVLRRLERFLAQAALARVGSPGDPVDPRLFRVVGTEPRPDLSDGAIARVVRAAVLQGERVVREGEVITCKRSDP